MIGAIHVTYHSWDETVLAEVLLGTLNTKSITSGIELASHQIFQPGEEACTSIPTPNRAKGR
jgi:hypothetical protein